MNKTTHGRYRSTALSNVFFALSFLASAIYFLTEFHAHPPDSIASTIFLIAAFTIAPLALILLLKHLSFSVSLENSLISVKSCGVTREMRLDDVICVDVKRMNLVLEAVYVRDRQGNSFTFERGLSNYRELKDILVFALERNLARREADALGSHTYSGQYKFALVCLVVSAWGFFFALFPSRLLLGEVNDSDLHTIGICAVMLSFAIPGSIVAASDLRFVLSVGPDRIHARRFGREHTIDLAAVSHVSVSQWRAIESISIKDRSSNTITFNRFLQDYEAVKRFLLRRRTRIFSGSPKS